ncbi:hypothetical protein, partial [Variovorax boronicumulans]|uniref:hypothetical protein n=1 Tax=Variovorax boronicumulans TaxID=436515 RepID=UPI0027D8331B
TGTSHPVKDVFLPSCIACKAMRIKAQGNEEQTAHLPTVLLHRLVAVRTQIRTAQRGSIHFS